MYFAKPIIVIFRHDPLRNTSNLLPTKRQIYQIYEGILLLYLATYLPTSVICYFPFDPVPCAGSYKPIKEVMASPKKPHSAVRHNSVPVSLRLRMAIRPTNQSYQIYEDTSLRHLTTSQSHNPSLKRASISAAFSGQVLFLPEKNLFGRGGGEGMGQTHFPSSAW